MSMSFALWWLSWSTTYNNNIDIEEFVDGTGKENA